ncbi:DUF6520 family protein [Flavivirga eckloniae]|uniref:Uncharacterized protein n=1 Tax=Flavivirga eckloniae TaxID=1803846 RepID=A0A2K9PMJ2_9FLAO|nr:DUF6520 family protein [Flavivirga eckloniae]AUP78281.1 hypothetical protein C1H87_05950 [Flavivirga eckloniae]
MKSKIFKIVLSAITLILAITASLAFTTNKVASYITEGKYLDSNYECQYITPIDCCETGCEDCTVFIFGAGQTEVYLKVSQCTIVLKKCSC